MATKIVTKNSSTASAVPTASDLVQGELAVNVADKRLFTEDNAGAIVELGTNPSGNVTFQDNGKAIFGAGSDLQIYHDGSNNRLDSVSSSLVVKAPQFVVQDAGGTKNMIWVPQGGSGYEVQLSHDGATKLTTTSTGIDVTGTATMDGLTVDSTTGFSWLPVSTAGAKVGAIGTGTGLIINTPSVNASFGSGLAIDGSYASDLSSVNVKAFGPKFSSYGSELNLFTSDDTSLLKRQTIASNGDISFYEDTGTTPKFFWDASAESLGIGTTSPATQLAVALPSGTNGDIISMVRSGGAYSFNLGLDDNSTWYVSNASDEKILNVAYTGNVGIGTSSPSSALSIARGSGVNAYIEAAGNNNTVGSTSMLFGQNGSNYGYCWNRANEALLFGTNNTERMRIDSSGNVGIGTSGAATKVDIRDIGGRTIQLGKNPTTNYYGSSLYMSVDVGSTEKAFHVGTRYSATGGSLVFEHSTNDMGRSGDASALTYTERMRIDSSGDIRLTGTAPNSEDNISTINFFNSSSGINLASITGKRTAGGTNYGSLIFNTTNSGTTAERMRIDSSGNLLVGTTSVISLGKQCIEFDGYSENGLILKTTNTSMGSAYLGFVNSSGAVIGSINQLSTSTVAYNTSSDQRLKENIADADDAGSKIDSIQVRKYDWKADGSHQDYGMIAQELQAVAPEAVSGDADSEEMMGVDYSKLVPMMLKEIQSLRNRVAQLEE